MFFLKPLPFDESALEPYISSETIKYHYGKHHTNYLDTLNKLIAGSEYEAMTLEEVIKNSKGVIFTNAAQVYNHDFYWKNLGPDGGEEPEGELLRLIEQSFETYYNFRSVFNMEAKNLVGSGWVWLVQNPYGKLEVISTPNADTIITTENKPLLVADVWEHAYYLDTKNDRARYLENFWNLVDWSKIEL